MGLALAKIYHQLEALVGFALALALTLTAAHA